MPSHPGLLVQMSWETFSPGDFLGLGPTYWLEPDACLVKDDRPLVSQRGRHLLLSQKEEEGLCL